MRAWKNPAPQIDLSDAERQPFRALAAAVIFQSIRDLFDSDIRIALDAAVWLVSPDALIFADAAGVPDAKFRITDAPQYRRVLRRRELVSRKRYGKC